MILRDANKVDILRKHIQWAKESGLCEQCVYPWHDGICECGEFETFKVQLAYNVSGEFQRQGDDLNDLK